MQIKMKFWTLTVRCLMYVLQNKLDLAFGRVSRRWINAHGKLRCVHSEINGGEDTEPF